MKRITTTDRLILREMSAATDAENAYMLNADSEVLRFTGDKPFGSVAEARLFLEEYTDYKEHKMGRWAVIRKDNNAFIGWCGLKRHKDYVDLGFRFLRTEWGQGFATEAALACLDLAFNTFGLKEVIGRVDENNVASVRVLEKCGMSYWKRGECNGIDDALYYRVEKPE